MPDFRIGTGGGGLTDEQFTSLKLGIGYVRLVAWPPAPEQYVGLRVLSRTEADLAYLNACQYVRDKGREGDEKLLVKAERDETLYLALRKVVEVEDEQGARRRVLDEPASTLFTSPSHLRDSIDESGIAKLASHYDELSRQTTPLTRAQRLAQAKEYEALARDLKKKASATDLDEVLLADVMEFIHFLLERVDLSAQPT